ncbi:MAG: hypothetical protein WCQ72_05100 [Eubacteriales bacterium]
MRITVKSDTLSLLRECESGAKTAVSAINEVVGRVNDEKLRECLRESRDEHARCERRCGEIMSAYDENSSPSVMPAISKSMSWLKTNFTLDVKPGDKTVAALMTDGCDMGIKSLSSYLNEFEDADREVKSIARRMLDDEKHLHEVLEGYL